MLSYFRKSCFQKEFCNQFYSKSFCYKANFNKSFFRDVNFKGAILTSCCFKNSKFINVEFLGTNLKGSNFTNSTFQDCVFSAALLKKVNFKNCSFKKCIFICTNLTHTKNFPVLDSSNEILLQHPSIPELIPGLKSILDAYKRNKILACSRTLFLKNGSLNSITMKYLLSRLSQENLLLGLRKLSVEELRINQVATASLFYQLIVKTLKSQ